MLVFACCLFCDESSPRTTLDCPLCVAQCEPVGGHVLRLTSVRHVLPARQTRRLDYGVSPDTTPICTDGDIISFLHSSTHAGAGLRRERNAPISRRSVLQGRCNVKQGTNTPESGEPRLLKTPRPL